VSDVVVDALGMLCPQPVIALAKAISTVAAGETVTVIADDPVAAVDIPAWCWSQGHEFLGGSDGERGRVYRVRRLARPQ
jgi:cysteine desulfurase